MDPTQDTDWPKEVANDVQALIDIVGMLPHHVKTHKDEAQIRTEVQFSIKLLLKYVDKSNISLLVSWS